MTQEQLLEQISLREQEVSSYETNYNNYTLMIESMGVLTLPEELKQYINVQNATLPMTLTLEQAQLISDYNYLEQIRKAQRSELLEMNKVKVLLNVLKQQVITTEITV